MSQDYALATAWFAKAAEQGYGDTHLNLARLYEAGNGVRQDYVHAYKWLSLTVGGFPADAGRHDTALRTRDLVAARMTPAQISEAQDLIADWQPLP